MRCVGCGAPVVIVIPGRAPLCGQCAAPRPASWTELDELEVRLKSLFQSVPRDIFQSFKAAEKKPGLRARSRMEGLDQGFKRAFATAQAAIRQLKSERKPE
jgi:hypothetical protein